MRVCIGTITHHPEDARIMHRQIRALLAAGHTVTYLAPFTDCNVTPTPAVQPVDVPRAVGTRRARALRAARGALRRAARHCDVLMVHDIELLLVLPSGRPQPALVWDVHRDPAATLSSRTLTRLVRSLESAAERRMRLILAEAACRERFTRPHPVVPNTTFVPAEPPRPPGEDRIVYLGHLSAARGAGELVELARRMRPHGIRMDLVGAADPAVRPLLRDAQREGVLDWFGHVPNRHALRMAEGALAGLSLLHDLPHHRTAWPAKAVEYMARGIPVISTPLPPAVSLVGSAGCGMIVPFGDVDAAERAVLRLREEPEERAAMGHRGHRAARPYHWPDHAPVFVRHLETWADATAPLPA